MKKGDEITAYKVVGKKNRECSNLVLFFQVFQEGHKTQKHIQIIQIIQKYINKNSRLFPIYTKGVKLKAITKTEGFFVFTTKKAAQEFIKKYGIMKLSKIIKVKGIVKKRTPRIITGCGDYPNRISSKISRIGWNYPVCQKTVTLSELEVLT